MQFPVGPVPLVNIDLTTLGDQGISEESPKYQVAVFDRDLSRLTLLLNRFIYIDENSLK